MRLILASGQSIELVKDTYSVGRAANSDVVISDPSVSRAHCRLSRTNAGWVVEDLSSQNGTFVNDKRIARATPLREGDVVRVGAVGILTAASQVQPAPARAAGAHAAAAPPASGSNSRALVLGLAIIGGAIVLVMLLFVLLNLNSGTGSGQPTVVSFALTAPPATETEPAEPTAAVLLQTRSLLATTSIQQPTTRPRTPAPPPTETEAPGITATPPFDTPGGFLYAPPELFDPPDGR